MKIGVHLPHIGRKATPEAEELGLADVWVCPRPWLPGIALFRRCSVALCK
jgi:hypothetical protein